MAPLFLALKPARSAIFEIESTHLAARGDGARLVLDLSADTPFRAFTLSSPDRVILDLPAPAQVADLPTRLVGPVAGLRGGAFNKGTWRLVIDLAAPARIEAASVQTPSRGRGHRLVVDLVLLRQGEAAGTVFGTWKPEINRLVAPVPRLPPGLERPTIVIDPGHGGVDPGAISRSGVHEKTVVLEFAAILALRLAASGQYNIRLTRNDDRFLPLRKRVAIGQAARADLFISLHADSIERQSAQGRRFIRSRNRGPTGWQESLPPARTRQI